MKINPEQIRQLRQKTGAGVMECKKALDDSAGNEKKALAWLKKKGLSKAEKKADREVKSGVIEAYTHADGQIVAVVELACETDFVARNEEFKQLAHELAMQVAAMKPKTVDDLLKQTYIKDEALKIDELVKEKIAKTGENIVIRRMARFELGE